MGLEQGGGIVDVSAATVLTVSFVIQVKARAAILQSLSFLGFAFFDAIEHLLHWIDAVEGVIAVYV